MLTDPDVELKLVAGSHAYVLAPLAVRVATCWPTQIVAEFTVTTGSEFTVTVEIALFVQPFIAVPVIV